MMKHTAILLVFALLCSACCCGLDKLGSGSGSGPSASEGKTEAPSTAAPAMKVAIKDLLKAYKENEVRADNVYKDKLVEVTGTVDDVKKDVLGDIYVAVGTGAQFEIPQVQCFAKGGQADAFAKLNKGQKVTVQGRVDGLMMNVLVRDCVVK